MCQRCLEVRKLTDDFLDIAKVLEGLLPKAQIALFRGTYDPFSHLPVGQLRLVRALEDGPKTPTALARAMGLTTGAVSQLATRLKAVGLVEEQVDGHDRRVKRLGLSEAGRSRMDERRSERTERVTEVLRKLTPEAQEALMASLQSLYAVSIETDPQPQSAEDSVPLASSSLVAPTDDLPVPL